MFKLMTKFGSNKHSGNHFLVLSHDLLRFVEAFCLVSSMRIISCGSWVLLSWYFLLILMKNVFFV